MKAIAAAFTFATLTVPAIAASSVVTMTVSVGDLDLASQQGREALALRIHRAASVLCAADAVDGLPQTIRNARACIRAAKSSTRAAVETLHAAQEARSGPARLATATRRD